MSVLKGPISTEAPPPREHILLENVSWPTYEALLTDLGDQRRHRIFYDRGSLEIMSPSSDHENLKKLIGRLLEVFTLELRIKILSVGSTTWKSAFKERGLEADESYYLQNEPRVRNRKKLNIDRDPPPDLAIETDLSTSVLNRLSIYAAIGIPEVWSHDGHSLRIYQLQQTGEYQMSMESAVLPMLPPAELERFLNQRDVLDETELMWAFREWVRERFPEVRTAGPQS